MKEKQIAAIESLKTIFRMLIADVTGFLVSYGLVDVLADALVRDITGRVQGIDPKTASTLSVVVWILVRYIIHTIDRYRYTLTKDDQNGPEAILPTMKGV